MNWKNILLILYIVILCFAIITGVKTNSFLGIIIYVPAVIMLYIGAIIDYGNYRTEKEKKDKEDEIKFYGVMDKIFNELENIRHNTEK